MMDLEPTLENRENGEAAAGEEVGIARSKVVKPEGKRLFSVKRMLVVLIVLCWGLPVFAVSISFYHTYQNGIMKKTQKLLENEVKNSAAIIAIKLNDAINDCKKVSYTRTIEKLWKEYKRGLRTQEDFYMAASKTMETAYGYSRMYDNLAMFYLLDEREQLCPDTQLGRDAFNEKVRKAAYAVSELNSTSVHIAIIDGNLYIFRNMYSVYGASKYATMVMRLNEDMLFSSINNNLIYDIAISLNNSTDAIAQKEENLMDARLDILEDARKTRETLGLGQTGIIDQAENEYEGFVVHNKEKDYILHTLLLVNREEVYSDLKGMNFLILIISLILLPLILFVIYFLSRHVTTPISMLVEASKKIRAGEIGVQISGDKRAMPNREFAYLMVSFNKMSSKIKYLFDYAYNEQLARKDAKILALQSQINPHFLNNTLEMMNWQARMSGDIAVSKMIEALSTLLEFSMDRSNKRSISLAEEIRCADAYLYIISMRFGQRLLVEKEIDQSLLQIQVPQLILQPLLENAVVHGIEATKRGTIWLKAYRQDNRIVLQVKNTGNGMSQEDVVRVRNLLSGCVDASKEKGKHVSLGIRNVNERIKLIYGEEYGLTILPVEEAITAATIIIPYMEREN